MGNTKLCIFGKKVKLFLGIVCSLIVITIALMNTFKFIDSRYAYAIKHEQLRSDFDEKKLRDEIFQLKLMIAQDEILNGGDSQTLVWMKDQLSVKETKLKTLLEKEN